MTNLNKILVGAIIGSSLTLGVDYLFNWDKELINIGHFGEPALGDSYLLLKGIGGLRHQTLYWPTILKEKELSDSAYNPRTKTLLIFRKYELDTLQNQASTKNLPLAR